MVLALVRVQVAMVPGLVGVLVAMACDMEWSGVP